MPSGEPDYGSDEKEPGRDSVEKPADFFGRLKNRKNKSRQTDNPHPPGYTWSVEELVSELKKLGLDPPGLGRFITSLHRLAVASNVDPQTLASLIRDLSRLSQGSQVSFDQIRARITKLSEEKTVIQAKISELEEKKFRLEKEITAAESTRQENGKSLANFASVREQLDRVGITIEDVSRLRSAIDSAAQLGYDPHEISQLLQDTKAALDKRRKADDELEQLLDSKRVVQLKLAQLENEIVEKQKIIESAENITRTGLAPEDLETISSIARMIARTRNVDETAARKTLLSDLQSYYGNDQELRNRLRTIEGLLREKEEKFSLLETDFRNEKAVLENVSKLISAGITETWLANLNKVISAYGSDLEVLAKELENRNGLAASIEELAKSKKALLEEERLLRQKVVAAEDQRLKTLAMINQMIVNASRSGEKDSSERPLDVASVRGSKGDFLAAAQKAIEMIRAKLPPDSPARLVLEHALLALKLESKFGS